MEGKKSLNWKIGLYKNNTDYIKRERRNSLAVYGLGLCTSTVGGMGSIPGGGTKIPHAPPRSNKKKGEKKTQNKENS